MTPSRVRHLLDSERGVSLIYLTGGFMAFFAATALAVDVGMVMTARTQAQAAADSGALAGAISLAVDDFDDRSPSGPAVQAAMSSSLENSVMKGAIDIEPTDVTFPVAPSGASDRIHVEVFRTPARGNPLSTFIMAAFGADEAGVWAGATAHAAPANAITCVRPFTIPDKWDENPGAWNTSSTFRRYDNQGNLLVPADEYIRPGQTGYQGYDPIRDKGTVLTIRAGTGGNIEPTFYYSWKMPGEIGADFYEENIYSCNQATFSQGAEMIQEPGNMVGPTSQGIDDLIAQDPSAYWDNIRERVVSPLGRSPRIFPIPLYDPDLYDQGKVNGRNATLIMRNWIGFFVERRTGNQVIGRIVPILGTIDPNAGPAPEGTFPRAVQLVE